jgi:MYXO-CTERM domain-containing protein
MQATITSTFSAQVVPAPGALALLAVAAAGGSRRRRR